jgi:hypothetical protein
MRGGGVAAGRALGEELFCRLRTGGFAIGEEPVIGGFVQKGRDGGVVGIVFCTPFLDAAARAEDLNA